MKNLYLILLTLVVAVLFKWYPPKGDPIGFPTHPVFEGKELLLNRDTYAYFIFQHVVVMIFYYIMMNERYKWAFIILIGLEVLDLISFIISYNQLHYGIVTMNTIKCAVFGGVVIYYARQDTSTD